MQESADLKDFITKRSSELGWEKVWSREEGALSIGTDATEWTEGHEAIVAQITEEFKEFFETVKTSIEHLRAFSEGTVGWSAARLTWGLPDSREVPVRATAVFCKDGDEWTCVQAHYSIGVPNEEVFG